MINVKDAYSYAVKYFTELVGDHECGLEEIELSPNSRYWIVTLSYYDKEPKTDIVASILVLKKLAKSITVDSEDGSFFSMKIAKLWLLKMIDFFEIKIKNGKILIPIKKGIIVDSNVMLLFLVGCYDINYINMFKRTMKYTTEEYYFIRDLLTTYYYKDKIYTSPHILTELSNLSKIEGGRRNKYFNFFVKILSNTCEIHIGKNKILEFKELPKFGITDIGIYKIAKKNNLLVLTDDFRLSSYLLDNCINVLNLRNISKYLWSSD